MIRAISKKVPFPTEQIDEAVRRFARAPNRTIAIRLFPLTKKNLSSQRADAFSKFPFEAKRIFRANKMENREANRFIKYSKRSATPLDSCGDPCYHGREEWCDDVHDLCGRATRAPARRRARVYPSSCLQTVRILSSACNPATPATES